MHTNMDKNSLHNASIQPVFLAGQAKAGKSINAPLLSAQIYTKIIQSNH